MTCKRPRFDFQSRATRETDVLSAPNEQIRREITPIDGEVELTVVLPCLNEARTLPACIAQIKRAITAHGISAEIIVADNGSSDGSADLAAELGARMVRVPDPGYGSALMGGIAAARGRYLIMGDADASYDFSDIQKFLEQLRAGSDLVMGNRFRGGIQKGAMPFLHRRLGNPVLSLLGRLFFHAPCGDFHCGLRGFSMTAYRRMDLQTTGMEFASEMVVKAALFGMKISEVPTTLAPAGRDRPPHLRSWRDGWRHLRFLMMYSPRWSFLYPGAALMIGGAFIAGWLLTATNGPRSIAGNIQTLLYAMMAILIGFQMVAFSVFTKVFAITEKLLPEDARLNWLFRHFRLETGLAAGGTLMALGVGLAVYSLYSWGPSHVDPTDSVRLVRLVASTIILFTLGVQICLTSFFLSILGLRRK